MVSLLFGAGYLALKAGVMVVKVAPWVMKGKAVVDAGLVVREVVNKEERITADVVNGVAQVAFGVLQTAAMVETVVGASHVVTLVTTVVTGAADVTRTGAHKLATQKEGLNTGDLADIALVTAFRGLDVGATELAEHIDHVVSCGALFCEKKEAVEVMLDVGQTVASVASACRESIRPARDKKAETKSFMQPQEMDPDVIIIPNKDDLSVAVPIVKSVAPSSGVTVESLALNVINLQEQDRLHTEYAKNWRAERVVPESIAVFLSIPRCQLSGKPIRYLVVCVLMNNGYCDKLELNKRLTETPHTKPANWPGKNPPTAADFKDAPPELQEKLIDSQLREWAELQLG